MTHWKTLAEIRRQYGKKELSEKNLYPSPFEQFKSWFEAILKVEGVDDPTAMVLSTVNDEGHPDSRVVLLKGIENDAFLFYTNLQSAKALQLERTPFAALNFYWPAMARQVRVRGLAQRISYEESQAYFSSRPIASQLSAIISPQSQKISDRSVLENAYNYLNNQPAPSLVCPDYWGGYRVIPREIEFWQGRNDRLHDRILYLQSDEKKWIYSRLAP